MNLTLVTSDNENEIYNLINNNIPVVFASNEWGNGCYYINEAYIGIGTMAKWGNWYYIQLPILNE